MAAYNPRTATFGRLTRYFKNREAQPHPSGQAPAANTGGNPSVTNPPSDLNANPRRAQGSSAKTTISTRDAQAAHRSAQMLAANAGGIPTALPQHDGNPSSKGYNSSTTDSTRGGNQPYRTTQEAHHGRPEDHEKGDSGSKKLSGYADHGGQRTQGDEGERRTNVLKKNAPARGTRGGERKKPQSGSPTDSMDNTMGGRSAHSYSSTDQERSALKATTAVYIATATVRKPRPLPSTTNPTNRLVHPRPSAQAPAANDGSPLSTTPSSNLNTNSRKPQGSSTTTTTTSTWDAEAAHRSSRPPTDSIDITMGGRGTHSCSPTDQERRMASKAITALANVQPQSRPGSQHSSYSRAIIGGKPQPANHHSETGSNAADMRAFDPMHLHQQLGSKSAQPLPPGAAEAQPPTANRHRQTQPGEDDSTDDSTHGDDKEPYSSHSQPPGGFSTGEEGQHLRGKGDSEVSTPQSSGYLSGLRHIILSTGPAQSPRDKTKEELHRTKARLQQLEYEFRRVWGDNAILQRTCFELDSENRRKKDTIRSLQHEVINIGRELQEYKNLSDIRGKELVANQVSLIKADKILAQKRGDLEFTNNEESLSAARAILDGTGATPVMAVIDAMLVLREEIANVSNFLAENITHTSYELFQEELDRCYQDSEKIIGERLSKALHDYSEAGEPSQSLIKITFQIFITSFCAHEWDHYLDTPLHVGE